MVALALGNADNEAVLFLGKKEKRFT